MTLPIPPPSLLDLVDCYNSTLSALLNKHAPVRSKLITSHKPNPLYTPALRVLKTARRRCEHQWRTNPSSVTLNLLRKATNFYTKSILAAKRVYYSELIQSVSNEPRQMWNTVNNILHRKQAPPLRSSFPSSSIDQQFGTFL